MAYQALLADSLGKGRRPENEKVFKDVAAGGISYCTAVGESRAEAFGPAGRSSADGRP